MTPARFNTIQMDLDAAGFKFKAYGETKVFDGYSVIYTMNTDDEEKKKKPTIPVLEKGDVCKCNELVPTQHFTQPPPRYTEASLVRALEDKGIGRPSTYAPTISTIIDRGYVQREKKVLHPTELGEIVTRLMCEHFTQIVNSEFTAGIEEELDQIAEGEKGWRKVLSDFYGPFAITLSKAEQEIEKVEIKDKVSDVKCDKCGEMMVYKRGRFGTFLACPKFPECRNTKAIVEKVGVPCPICSGNLIKRYAKKGRRPFYGCENYPECEFVSWDLPVEEKCPECGSFMVEKYLTSQQKTIHKCSNKDCGYSVEVNKKDKDTDNKGNVKDAK